MYEEDIPFLVKKLLKYLCLTTNSAHLKRLTNTAVPSLRLQLEPLPKNQAKITSSVGFQRTTNYKSYNKTLIQSVKKTPDQVKTYPNKTTATVPTVKKAQDVPVQIYQRIVPNTDLQSIHKSAEHQSFDQLLLNNSSIQVDPPTVVKEVPRQPYQVNCAVKNCPLYREAGRLSKNLSFHEIPEVDLEKRKLWLQV